MNIFNFFKPLSVTVVIPVYQEFDDLNHYERLSLIQCKKVLYKYPITIVCPENLHIKPYETFFSGVDIHIATFAPSFFKNTEGYNALMLDTSFYHRFLNFTYILIYQLDAFVFQDRLKYWCRKNYDYIGAPWLTDKFQNINKEKAILFRADCEAMYKENRKHKDSGLPVDEQFYNKVGNGGLSLRKVKRMIHVLMEMPDTAAMYIRKSSLHHFFNEDVFWSLEANREKKRLKIPNYKEAVYFSMEFMPEIAFHLTKGVFPFGCHDWDNNLPFWRNKFKMKGIEI